MTDRIALARVGALMSLLALGSCGGGGGGGGDTTPPPPPAASCTVRAQEFIGVCTGFPDTGNLDWNAGGDGGGGVGDGGGSASGDGGVGAGGDFGQFRNVTISVFKDDGTLLGSALTDAVKGMVTIRPGLAYRGSLRLELTGGANAEYFEEGKNRYVPFPAGRVIRVIVPRIDKNIGITAFTEAAYQLLTQGSAPESVGAGNPTPAQITAANERVRALINEHYPRGLQLASGELTRLPFLKSPSVAQGSLTNNPRGIYGVVSGTFSKQAALFNTGSDTPTLDAVAQLAEDLRDGDLDGRNGNAPAAPAGQRTYDPQTLTGEISSALAHQAERFGSQAIKDMLPPVVNYGGTRYKGYLFDSAISKARGASSTVTGWLAGNALNLSVGQVLPKALPLGQSAQAMISNFGHGGAFFKIDSSDTTANPVYRYYALGDNANGELATGNQTDTDRALVEITLPGALTHAAGGFAHTVLRLADGRVFAVGDNSFGQLGQGSDSSTLPRSSTPLQVVLPGGAVAVAATSVASYALMADGTVYTWGSNGGFGLLGNGQAAGTALAPVLVAGLSDVVQMTARDNDVLVLKRDQTLVQWGSHPADVNAYTDGDVTAAYRGGTFAPTPVAGLPTTVQLADGRTVPVRVRKIITEQGLFAALLNNGHVYAWGVHFDLSAKAVLRDLSAARVLGLPPLRDMMPGGFVGYGARPFDRLTALGVDYRGGLWKLRGRVAERFEITDRTAQRRPQTGVPRSANCATCHTFLDEALETLRERQLAEAPVSATAPICQPPTTVHQATNGSTFIHAETECIQCHNPARLDARYAGQLAPAFVASGGWPNCNKPTNLPARSNVPATPITAQCSVPVNHSFTPPGTVCSSCHNSVAARALQDLVPPCLQPSSASLPTINKTASITAVIDDNGVTVTQGAYTVDTTPRLQGALSAALSGSQTLEVSRNAAAIGNASASGTTWSYTDPAAPQGTVVYTVRVKEGTGFGPTSNTYTVRVDNVPPSASAAIAALTDDVFGAVSNNGFASDSTPTVSGTLSAALANGDVVQVLRNDVVVGSASVTGTAWTYTEPAALTVGTYAYKVRVTDAAGNNSGTSPSVTFTLIGGVPGAAITGVFNDANASIAGGSTSSDNTPRLAGTLSAALPTGYGVQVLRGGTVVGLATVTGLTWGYTDTAPEGNVSYTARVKADAVLGAEGTAYAFTVDSIAPTQTAAVTLIADRFIGGLAPGASTADQTPTISGTVSAALGSGEQLRLRRTNTGTNAVVDITVPVTGTTWSYLEPSLLAVGTYTYQAQVFDAAGNTAAFSATRSVTINLSAIPLPGAGATLDTLGGFTVAALPSVINNNTPVLTGTIARALNTGEVVRVYRGGVGLANATVASGATTWSYTNTALAEGGPYSFFARVELGSNSAVFGASSNSAAVSIDTLAPTQTVNMSIVDDNLVAVQGNNTSDTTPLLQGTLSAAFAPGSGETLEVVRTGGAGGTLTRSATVTNTNWSLQESVLPLATYTYTVRPRDPAGNRGSNTVQTVNVITTLPSVSAIDVVYSAGLGAPRADGTVVGSGASIADATPTVRITLAASLPAGASVQVTRVRSGSANATVAASGSGTNWTLVDTDVGQGQRSYTAQVTNGTAYGSVSGGYSVLVDTVAPAQTFAAITGASSVMPNTAVTGATTPADGTIASGGTTNDESPVLRVQLLAALGSGESLRIRRNGSIVAALSTSSCGANCFLVSVPAPIALPEPPSAPNSGGVPSATQGYTFTVVDAALNESAATPAFNIVFNYFACDIVRANATRQALVGLNHTTWLSTTNCNGCHLGTTSGNVATPSGALVPVPSTTPTYWCRRP